MRQLFPIRAHTFNQFTLEKMKNFIKTPYIYEIEPTNHCPYTCIMCPKGLGRMKRPLGFMKLDTFQIILEQFPPSQKLVRMHHFGEAVLHPGIDKMLKSVHEQGLFSVLSLNPASLTLKLNRKIAKSGVDLVCFSLDAFNDEGLHKIRGIKRSYENCRAMIDDFIAVSRKLNRNILKVIQMVRLDANKEDCKKFQDIKKIYPESDVSLYLAENNGFGNLDIVEQTLVGGSRYILPGTPCGTPFSEVAILWNGDVVLCCYDYDGFNVIGNVHEEKLSKMWQGSKVNKIRALFENRQTRSLPLCSNCFLAPDNFRKGVKLSVKGVEEERTILKILSDTQCSSFFKIW